MAPFGIKTTLDFRQQIRQMLNIIGACAVGGGRVENMFGFIITVVAAVDATTT